MPTQYINRITALYSLIVWLDFTPHLTSDWMNEIETIRSIDHFLFVVIVAVTLTFHIDYLVLDTLLSFHLSLCLCMCMCMYRVEMLCLERSDNKIRFETLCSKQCKIHLRVISISMLAVGCTHRNRCDAPYGYLWREKSQVSLFNICSGLTLLKLISFDFKCHFVRLEMLSIVVKGVFFFSMWTFFSNIVLN